MLINHLYLFENKTWKLAFLLCDMIVGSCFFSSQFVSEHCKLQQLLMYRGVLFFFVLTRVAAFFHVTKMTRFQLQSTQTLSRCWVTGHCPLSQHNLGKRLPENIYANESISVWTFFPFSQTLRSPGQISQPSASLPVPSPDNVSLCPPS